MLSEVGFQQRERPGGRARDVESFDVDERVVMKSLFDGDFRKILASTVDRAKSTQEISQDCGIPPSTCYLRVSELVRGGVLRRERVKLTWNRKRYALYRATVSTIIVSLTPEGLDVVAVANGEQQGQPLAAAIPIAISAGLDLPP